MSIQLHAKQVCLETLQELAMANPRMVAHANGFRVLLAAAIDPANQVTETFMKGKFNAGLQSLLVSLPRTSGLSSRQLPVSHHTEQDLVDPLVTSLMAIVEDPMTRRYVRPRLELHQLLTGFTDLDAPPGPDQAHRWKVGVPSVMHQGLEIAPPFR